MRSFPVVKALKRVFAIALYQVLEKVSAHG